MAQPLLRLAYLYLLDHTLFFYRELVPDLLIY